jgi:hypothetical protein
MARSKQRKKTIEQKPQGQCIFCQGHGMTKQHIWPDWMSRDSTLPTYRPSPNPIYSEVTFPPPKIDKINKSTGQFSVQLQAPQVVIRQGPPGSRKLRLVCRNCNGGWMNTIENSSRDIIASLMKDERTILSQDEQIKLAYWITLITIVNEFTDIKNKAVPYQQRKYFQENKTPPEGWLIWIGRYNGTQWDQLIKHIGLTFLSPGSAEDAASEISDTQVTSFAVGKMFAFVISTSRDESYSKLSKFQPKGLIKLWPDTQAEIDLSTEEPISDELALATIAVSQTTYPISSDLHVVATVVKPVLGIGTGNPVHSGLYGFFQGLPTAGLGRAQGCFELAPGLFNRREVG